MTQGKRELNEMGGSFLSPAEQKKLESTIAKRHESFANVVDKQSKERRTRSNRKITDDISEPDQGVRLTQDDITGGLEGAVFNNTDSREEPKDDDDFEISNEYGDTICKYCKSVLKTDKPKDILDITDDELTTYIFGGRISRKFSIGSVEFAIQSLLQNEVDEVSYRAGQDLENGNVSLEVDYRTKHSVYRLVFSLVSMQGKSIIPDLSGKPTTEDLNAWFDKKHKAISSYSHQIVVLMSEKQALLERSINFAINDQVRLKN